MKPATLLPLSALLLQTTALPADNYPTDTLDQHRAVFRDTTPENFDDGGRISHYVFKNITAFYRTALIARTGEARALPLGLRPELGRHPVRLSSGEQSLASYVNESPHINAMIVLHRGRIAYEAYPNMEPYERHYSWSIGKVVTSAALAVLAAEGRIDVDAPVDRFLPELARTAWAGTSVRDVVNMASGIDCLDGDGYQNPDNCIYRLEESLNLTAQVREELPSTLDAIRSMRRKLPAGERYEYRSVDTMVIGLIIERITEKPLWSAFQDLVWDRIGPEADAYHYISEAGVAYAAGGMFFRLRDVARFGQLYVDSGGIGETLIEHRQILAGDGGILLPDERIAALVESQPLLADDLPNRAAWQWDLIWPDGAMYKSGYGGQGLYIDPNNDLVIAWFGTHDTDWKSHELVPVSRQLTHSELFPPQSATD